MEVLWPQQPEIIRRRAAGTDQANFRKLPKVVRLLSHTIFLVLVVKHSCARSARDQAFDLTTLALSDTYVKQGVPLISSY